MKKNMKTKLYILAIFAAVALVSCDLNQYPQGDNITKDQFDEMDDVLGMWARGTYPLLYTYGGDHDVFGQRSVDLATDLLCGDVAMKSQRYGWFVSDEQGLTYQRAGYYWSLYYNVIRHCNIGINYVDKFGHPELDFNPETMTDEQYLAGNYYAQFLTMRGWAYAALQRFFCKTVDQLTESGSDIYTELSVPIYTEEATLGDTILGAPRATAADVYLRIEQDLLDAIDYFEAYDAVPRASKLQVNVDVARMILAYSYLNKGENEKALEVAEDLIETTSAKLLPNEEVLTTGFNDVKHSNWIWGQDVNIETTTSLASFFGQCDIYSYSYASAGDVKGIDANLLKEITALGWDIRENWWGNYYRANGSSAANYQYAPDGKFYSAASTELQGDRDWLSDHVFMRLETAYLIAAEAAWRIGGKDAEALNYLDQITSKRVKEGAETAYADYKNALATDHKALGEAIRYNWRVELWGEGYGLQTFRRWGETVTLGENHLRMNKTLVPSTIRIFTFIIPSSETNYNPYIRPTTEMAVDNN